MPRAAKNALPINPYSPQDLANARQILEVGSQLMPLLVKGQNCQVGQCATYIQQVQAQMDFAQKVIDEFGDGESRV